MRCSRRFLPIALLACGWPIAARADTVHACFPYRDGMLLRYRATTTLDDQARLQWLLSLSKTAPGPAETEQVTLRTLAKGWQNGKPLEREETFLRDARGIFAAPRADASFGPDVLLPGMADLARPDTVWSFEGPRALPFALHLLGVGQRNLGELPTYGLYHVLAHGPLETAAGSFADAIQVTAIEQVAMRLLGQEPEIVLFRARRFYVRDLGLVREQLAFLDYPRLGVLTTELETYQGAAPQLAEDAAERTGTADESSKAT